MNVSEFQSIVDRLKRETWNRKRNPFRRKVKIFWQKRKPKNNFYSGKSERDTKKKKRKYQKKRNIRGVFVFVLIIYYYAIEIITTKSSSCTKSNIRWIYSKASILYYKKFSQSNILQLSTNSHWIRIIKNKT